MLGRRELLGLLVWNSGRRDIATLWRRQTREQATIRSLGGAPQAVQVLSAVAEPRCGFSARSFPD